MRDPRGGLAADRDRRGDRVRSGTAVRARPLTSRLRAARPGPENCRHARRRQDRHGDEQGDEAPAPPGGCGNAARPPLRPEPRGVRQHRPPGRHGGLTDAGRRLWNRGEMRSLAPGRGFGGLEPWAGGAGPGFGGTGRCAGDLRRGLKGTAARSGRLGGRGAEPAHQRRRATVPGAGTGDCIGPAGLLRCAGRGRPAGGGDAGGGTADGGDACRGAHAGAGTVIGRDAGCRVPADRLKGAAALRAGVGNGPGQQDGLTRAPEAACGNGSRPGGAPRYPPGQRPRPGTLSLAGARSLGCPVPLACPIPLSCPGSLAGARHRPGRCVAPVARDWHEGIP